MKLTLSAVTVEGRALSLAYPLELRFDADREVPCDALDVTLPLQGEGAVLRELSVRLDGKPLFDGIVDRQTVEKGEGGRLLRLECRSRAALLVDNEVKPAVYVQLTSGQLLERYALPFGAAGAVFPYEGRLGLLQVKKGASCWMVIEDFCRRVYRKTPYLDRRRFLVLDPLTGRVRTLSNRAGMQYASIVVRRKNDKLISRLYVKTATEVGGYYYGMVIDNKEALDRGVRRERYFHPAGEDDVDGEARRLLREAGRESFSVEVLLPGFFEADVGDEIRLPDERIPERLILRGLSYRMGAGGATTRLTLENRDDA